MARIITLTPQMPGITLYLHAQNPYNSLKTDGIWH